MYFHHTGMRALTSTRFCTQYRIEFARSAAASNILMTGADVPQMASGDGSSTLQTVATSEVALSTNALPPELSRKGSRIKYHMGNRNRTKVLTHCVNLHHNMGDHRLATTYWT